MANLYREAERHIPQGYDPALYRIRHSAAHVLAQATRERFGSDGDVRLGIGPPIDSGFYYDFELPRPATTEDLAWIESRMKEVISQEHEFTVREVTLQEAHALFENEPYKLELLDGLAAQELDENGIPLSESEPAKITVYQHDSFVDLCRGPHVRSTRDLNPTAVKLLGVAGAYWRGDETRPMLQRIYGTAWKTPEELGRYLWQRGEAERRDHRRIGVELELFHFDPTSPGMAYWLPKGLKVLTEILNFWRIEHEHRGYQEISTPIISSKALWETSGHWDHYKDNMFVIPIDEHVTYGVKPMNCPNAMIVFNLKTRSYRDLPLRLSDCDILHRDERSGTLHGLLRAQEFRQDDAHIFVTEAQIEEEYDRILEITELFYDVFSLRYSFRLGTRPSDYIGDLETWDKAESDLVRILDRRVGREDYVVAEGDGAFYGPKIDILMEDALGRSWQMGTIQLDFQLPRRFGCAYVDADGAKRTPVVIHRVIYGSLERFIGILIEHTEGALPVWLAPIQVRVIPIVDAHLAYAEKVVQRLRQGKLRVELDDSPKRMNAKVREAQLQKIPYMLIVGNNEMTSDTVSVRLRTEENLGQMHIDRFIEMAQRTIDSKGQI